MKLESNIKKFKVELDTLIKEGEGLSLCLAVELEIVDSEMADQLRKQGLPNFNTEYDLWYSASLQVIKQLLPDRLSDFVKQYKDEKRKKLVLLTYTIQDYLLGCGHPNKDINTDYTKATYLRIMHQLNILKAAKKRLEYSLFDMAEILQADLFDNELEAAVELAKKGFLRGAGAVAGVVLEAHLGYMCGKHKLIGRKKVLTISVLNDMLKDGGVIDTPLWRFIQRLGDLRNLCDHKKNRDPTKADIDDLIEGVAKIIKTLF